ncbi:MAG TPA: hypothetical protein VJ596_08895 [Gemmatimonadaceae bacterium]|nr:hypothetical protein [Gemmatimonadaceae bacterium]
MPRGKGRYEILHVRLSEDERERLRLAAKGEYLDESTWARRAILLALDDLEADQRRLKAVAEPKPDRDE